MNEIVVLAVAVALELLYHTIEIASTAGRLDSMTLIYSARLGLQGRNGTGNQASGNTGKRPNALRISVPQSLSRNKISPLTQQMPASYIFTSKLIVYRLR